MTKYLTYQLIAIVIVAMTMAAYQSVQDILGRIVNRRYWTHV